MLFLLVVGLFKGPTCKTKLMTAVQTEKLHTLHRLKNTSKVMDRLRVHIHRTQGALKREALNKMPTQPLKNQNTQRQAPSTQFKNELPITTKRAGLIWGCLYCCF